MTQTALDERGAVRRAVKLEFELWDEFGRDRRMLWSRDLSTRGVWLESDRPLEPGEFVLLRVRLPTDETTALFLTGIVRRSELRGREERPSGIAIEFMGPDERADAALSNFLLGRPPPLPGKPDPTRAHRELVDVDMNVVIEERQGDALSVTETKEKIAWVEEDEIELVALGSLLTGGRSPKGSSGRTSAAA